MRIAITLTIAMLMSSMSIEAQITKTVSVPQEKYAAYIVPDPGSTLTLKIVPDGVKALPRVVLLATWY